MKPLSLEEKVANLEAVQVELLNAIQMMLRLCALYVDGYSIAERKEITKTRALMIKHLKERK